MKNATRIISLLIALSLMLSCFATATTALTGDVETEFIEQASSETVTDGNICSMDTVGDYAFLDSEMYYFSAGEAISLAFSVNTESEISSYTFTQSGLSVLTHCQSTDEPNKIEFTAEIVDSTCELVQSADLSVSIMLDSGEMLTPRAFFYIGEEGVSISSASHNEAERDYYYTLYQLSKLTEDEYLDLVNKTYSRCVTQQTVASEKLSDRLSNRPSVAVNYVRDVIGELLWQDSGGQTHPLRGVKVEIYSSFYSTRTPLETTHTDSDGIYEFTSLALNINTKNSLFLKIYAGDDNAKVCNKNGIKYAYETDEFKSTSTVTVVDTPIFDMTDEFGQALQLSQALITARDFAWNMQGGSPEDVKLRYPVPPDEDDEYPTPYYSASQKTIYILDESIRRNEYLASYESWDVVMHEYGHHIQHELDITDSPGGTHVSFYNQSEVYGPYKGIRLAWGEAWATVFAFMSQQYFAYLLEDLCCYAPECPSPDSIEFADHICFAEDDIADSYTYAKSQSNSIESECLQLGDGCEESIIGVLWDLYDYGEELYDEIGVGSYGLWNITTCDNAISFSDFMEDFYAACSDSTNTVFSADYADKIAPNLEHYNMAGRITYKYNQPNTVKYQIHCGGARKTYNNTFNLYFYDANNDLILVTPTFTGESTYTYYSLTEEDWASILAAPGDTYSVMLKSMAIREDEQYNNTIVTTGPYYSTKVEFSK